MNSKFGKYIGNERDYIDRYLDTETKENKNFPWVAEFEREFTKISGAKYAIAVSSATAGLHAALEACNLEPDDEVISPGLTVMMNAFVTIKSGLTPVFADVNPETWNVDVDSIKKKITKKTKAIMPVSLFGLPLDIDPIMELARENNLIVIDDSAETILGSYKGSFAGNHADVAVYSFENKKHMTSGGEGGMIITSDEELATKMRKFAGIGFKNLTASAGRVSMASSEFQNPTYLRHDLIGLNYRMTPLNAAVGLAQLERINELVSKRIKVGEMFEEAVSGCTWMVPQKRIQNANHTYLTAPFKFLGEKAKSLQWKEFYDMYKANGGDGFYAAWMNPYLEPALRGKKFNQTLCVEGLCPHAEDLQKKLMLFKTNYRDLNVAEKQAEILSNLIDEIGRN